jgi:hypothetical protein
MNENIKYIFYLSGVSFLFYLKFCLQSEEGGVFKQERDKCLNAVG